jgi:aromatic-L-amino-acid decarboxylase
MASRSPVRRHMGMLSTSKSRNPLDLNGADFSALMADIVSGLAQFLDQLPFAPMSRESDTAALLSDPAVRQAPPESGRPLDELLDILRRAADNDINAGSGGAMAYIPGGGLVSSAAADLLSGVLNHYTGVSAVTPALVALEADVLRWLTGLMGLPSQAGGILTSGGSLAIFSAIVCARTERLPDDFRGGVLYTTDQTHHALAKAMRLAGFPRDALRVVAADSELRMDVDALKQAIAADRLAGRVPFCIAANAGTTNTGAIDPLPALARVAREERLWFHVDAAYGGFFQLTERGRERLAGIEEAHSIVLDPHKGLFLPFGTGCLLVREREVLQRAHSSGDPEVLRDLREYNFDLPDFSELSPELTRPYRGLRLWLPLHLHGVAAFRDALDQKLDLAERAYRALMEIPRLEVIGVPRLSVVAFRCRVPDSTPAEVDLATQEMVRHINAMRRAFLSTTVIKGRTMARIAVLNHRTTAANIDEVVETIAGYAARFAGQSPVHS